MISRFAGMLIAIILVLSMASIALARGAPTKKAFSSKAAVEVVTPTVANVPVLTGYDVIQNLSTEPRVLFNSEPYTVDISTSRRQSTTGDARSINAMNRSGSTIGTRAPAIVLLA